MRKPGPRLFVGLAATLALGAPLMAQQPPAPRPSEEQAAESLALARDWTRRMTVPVNIGGRGPYHFVVDTGAERTVISRELARELALGPGPTATVHSMTEVSQIGTVVIPGLRVGRRTMSDIHAPALDRGNLGAAGMLGVDSLSNQRIVFDFARQRMTLTPSGRRDVHRRAGIAVRGREYQGRLMVTNASVDGQSVVVIVDTGSQVTVGNEALRRQLARRNRLGPTLPIELHSITGGSMPADYGVARRVRLGHVIINNLAISFAEVHPFRQLGLTDRPALLLGMETLQLFARVSVDVANRQLRLLMPGDDYLTTGGVSMADSAGPRILD